MQKGSVSTNRNALFNQTDQSQNDKRTHEMTSTQGGIIYPSSGRNPVQKYVITVAIIIPKKSHFCAHAQLGLVLYDL